MLENKTLLNECDILWLCVNTTVGYNDEQPELSREIRTIQGVVILTISLLIIASNVINVVVLRAILAPFLSSFTIVFTSISITRALKKGNVGSTINTDGIASNGNDNRRRHRERKAVQLIITATVMFFAFWGPYVVVTLTSVFGKVVIPVWLEFTVTWMGNANSFVNVMIYSWIYPAFRSEAKSLMWNTIRCQCCRNSRHRRRVDPDVTESNGSC
ncbi:trace amine-associated receptor 7b-like [Liolophura sinensis]|uniref:trace amine-associated receptor 7b-like n=1 Tax=Liolophura sinensis TaxID=3198878 RepID=UPI00315865B2